MSTRIYDGDLPDTFPEQITSVAVDTETTGLEIFTRDRLCLMQFCTEHGEVFLVQPNKSVRPKNIITLLSDTNCTKIFHYARFDMAALYLFTKVMPHPIFCTKIASVLARTYSNKHGLKIICQELLNQNISKAEQSSYWGGPGLTDSQKQYAAHDVLFLHEIKYKLSVILQNEKRDILMRKCCDALSARVELDLAGFSNIDIFHHNPYN